MAFRDLVALGGGVVLLDGILFAVDGFAGVIFSPGGGSFVGRSVGAKLGIFIWHQFEEVYGIAAIFDWREAF